MAVATKKRPKSKAKAEAEAKALKGMPDDGLVDIHEATGLADKLEFGESDPATTATIEERLILESEGRRTYTFLCECGHEWQEGGPQAEKCPKCGHVVDRIRKEIEDEQRKVKAFDEIADLNDEVEKAFTTWSIADKRAKDLKKSYEGAVAELRSVISKTAHPAPMPLFDSKFSAAGESDDDATTPAADSEAWKNIPLREALPELSATIHNKLEGAQLFTMGELANWTAESGGRRRLTDIAGIGGAASGKIEEATMAFWARQKAVPVDATNESTSTQYSAATNAFRMVPILWTQFFEQPADASKIQTVGQLEDLAASVGLSIFDTLKNAGMGSVAADDVVQWLKETREEMTS